MKRMSAFVGLCVVAATLATTACTPEITGQPAPQKATWANFTNITHNSGGMNSLEANCKHSDPNEVTVKIPLDNATDGVVNVTVSLRGKPYAHGNSPVIKDGTTSFVISPPISRSDLTGDEWKFEVNNNVNSDSHFVVLTADQCRVTK